MSPTSMLCLVLLVSLLGSVRFAQAQFIQEDIEVCPASAGVFDPEFDSATQLMVFFDTRRRLKVAPVRPNGTIGTLACRGVVIDHGGATRMPDFPVVNGPEWAHSNRGTEIFYTKLDPQGQAGMARAWFDTQWRTEWLPGGIDRGLALPTTDSDDLDPRLLYVHSLDEGGFEVMWRQAADPESEARFDAPIGAETASAPRWVSGQRAISTRRLDANGVMQAARFFIDSDFVEILTSDAGSKDEVWIWPAPEFGGEHLMMAVVDKCCLHVYRKIAGVWTVILVLDAGSFSIRPYIFSPEPLVYRGRSYVVMVLAGSKSGVGEIWMTAVDPTDTTPVLLSDPSQPNAVRIEPEWMITPRGVFVYYTQMQLTKGLMSLRRLKTPL